MRGRRGRGQGVRRGHNRRLNQDTKKTDESTKNDNEVVLDINDDVKRFFTANTSFDCHYETQENHSTLYMAGLSTMLKMDIEVPPKTKSYILAAAWSRKDTAFANSLLINRNTFALTDVLKAINILDAKREGQAIEKKIERLSCGKPPAKQRKLGRLKNEMDNVKNLQVSRGSVSGAFSKHIKKWVQAFSKEELEFFAMFYPKDPWKKLADICHLNPKTDFALDWFLPFCFGSPAPEETMLFRCESLTADNVNDLIKEFDIHYSFIKTKPGLRLTDESKLKIAMFESLDTVIWEYEDLQCEKVDELLLSKLKNNEEVKLKDGKLFERLLTIKQLKQIKKRNNISETISDDATFYDYLLNIGQKRLDDMQIPLEPPIVVIGDRSGSMEVAIKTSTIIGALISAVAKAKLVFFNNKNMDVDEIPKNMEDVLEMATTITACNSTAPAASLYPFYERKEVVKTFIIVTDEEENTSHEGFRFKDIYKKYYEEIYPAKLVFVTFLGNSQHGSCAIMYDALVGEGFSPLQFNFSRARPDLNKLSGLLGLLSADTMDFKQTLDANVRKLENDGMTAIFEKMSLRTN